MDVQNIIILIPNLKKLILMENKNLDYNQDWQEKENLIDQ